MGKVNSFMRRRWWSALLAMLLAASVLVVAPSATPPVAAALGTADSLADFEGGAPSGFFAFAGGSSVTTSVSTIADTDALARAGQVGDNDALQVAFDVFDFGGFGEEYASASAPQDWSSFTSFDFWFYGTGSGLSYQAEISDNRSDPNLDTSERFDYAFTDTVAGWQYISIPFGDFTRAVDFQPGGAPDDGFTLTEIWAWAIVLPLGADTVFFDDFGIGRPIIDDFESGLPTGVDGDGVPVGFFTFSDGSPISIATTTTPPAPLPDSAAGNTVLQMDAVVSGFAGFIHNFTNAAANVWTPQDWTGSAGFSFWLYGNNSGTQLFVDLVESRNLGSVSDDAERWTVAFVDDFSGWQKFEFAFSDFTRKEIGNGAPNDGLTLDTVHGWAFGTLNTGGPQTYYLDNVTLFGVGEVAPLTVTFADAHNFIEEGTTGNVVVKLNRPMTDDDPAQVSVDFATESAASIAVEGRDYVPTSGTLTFTNGGPSELSFSIETFDDTKWTGDQRIVLRLSNPVDVEPGFITQASGFVADNEEFDPNLIDDFERGTYLWTADDGIGLATTEVAADGPLAVPGQGAQENVLQASTPLAVDTLVAGNLCNQGNGVVIVAVLTTDTFDATTIDHTTVRFGDASETRANRNRVIREEADFDDDGDIDLVLHFRVRETGYDCDTVDTVLTGSTFGGQPVAAGGETGFDRDFAIGEDWTRAEALRFWFYGTGSGDEIGVTLKDNRAPDPGPSGWSLAWSDEFDEPAGTPPNPANWTYEIGDVTPDGKNGWGNEELQYYTDDPANAATDGAGNLVITLAEADGSLDCFYGPCEYTSARLTTTDRTEFTYGRVESRLRVPTGAAGLWPAFWSLGTDIARNPWPSSGEIDFMEYVSRLPNEIFGTIHGPGYAGGASFGDVYDFGEAVYNDFHTFAVEWEPTEIRWYVDGVLYHTATPADVAPNAWVFDKPFYMLLNFAIGGNFGGSVSPELTVPQEYIVDYVRLYQAPDTAERFEASFVDNFIGWQEVVVPFGAFTRSADQPVGAPDDGLNLTDVWGYGFDLPNGGTTDGSITLDQVRLQLLPPPMEITVTNLNDSGSGSLRQALEDVAIGGTITFDPALAGGTVSLASGPLVPKVSVTVDGSGAPGLSLSGLGIDRVLVVEAGLSVDVAHLVMTNGYGFHLAGCVLNNGALTLDHVTVTGCVTTTDSGDFWQGGGGIYNGGGALLHLVDSTVSANSSGWSGGGVFSFFGSSTVVERSTISGNTSQDVGGGLRLLGDADVTNSTISGNTAIAWHGGAVFQTDGVLNLTNSTVADNSSPAGTAALFVGTFTDAGATLALTNTIVSNATLDCFAGHFGAGAVALVSNGHNVDSDGTCNLSAAGDQPNTDPLLGPLADNGGPTFTHAIEAASPAFDAADAAGCPAVDQRGVARPGGAGCDVGAFEYVP